MNIKLTRSVLVTLTISAIISTNLNAQVLNDVIKVYNEGAKAQQTDIPAAIKSFENVIVLADQVGADAADLKQKAIKALPGLYYNLAANALNEKKPAPETIKASKTAIAMAEKYGSATVKDNAVKVLIKGYNAMAVGYFSANDYPNALMAFDSILAINPGYLSAINNKALVYRKQGDSDNFEKTIDLYIEQLKTTNDTVNIQKASSMALEYFRGNGSKANLAGKLDEAIIQLDKASKYGVDKTVFYYYAEVYNKQKNYDRGAECAQKGLDLETGDANAKAKFYYQLAVAQLGKGQKIDACATFKNAIYGDFAEAAKAQRKNLQCAD